MRVEVKCGCGASAVFDGADMMYTEPAAWRWMREHPHCTVRAAAVPAAATGAAAIGGVGLWDMTELESFVADAFSEKPEA